MSIIAEDKDNRTELLRKIKDEVLSLKTGSLFQERKKNNVFPVIGEGSYYAEIMFVGEAPGKNEAETGRPFCGAAGKVLDKLLLSISLNREKVYVTNILKDRPPSNRDPLPEEIELYAPFLDKQIQIIKPKVIATLGRFSMEYIIRKFGLESELEPIGKMHGRVFSANTDYGRVKIVPLYHPAVALYNGSQMDTLKEDFNVLRDAI
ncbi:uracil-DNA glycosylase [Patescibacteria group bacterium]|nr:uracil-DNA glycosylase [Patescibacteria group bacterium]